jgi:hypothetical protein
MPHQCGSFLAPRKRGYFMSIGAVLAQSIGARERKRPASSQPRSQRSLGRRNAMTPRDRPWAGVQLPRSSSHARDWRAIQSQASEIDLN